jgi:hypothetical protein
MHRLRIALLPVLLLVLAACSGDTGSSAADASAADATAADATDTPSAATTAGAQRYPDIVDVELEPQGDDVYDVRVTVSSPYDTPQRYADGWRVLTPDGTELGTHTLLHDHANEQPFTRTQPGVEIPPSVDEITVEGRDQRSGFGGQTVTVPVPRSSAAAPQTADSIQG